MTTTLTAPVETITSMRRLTGFKPTGRLHLGNYLGAVRPVIESQDITQSIVMIVDLHALTVEHDPDRLRLLTTEMLATTLACGVVVFFYFNYVGIKEQGLIPYLKHFGGPIIFLAPLMFIIEMIGVLVRPVSLALRLFGNITGDHMVLGIFSDLVPIGVPVIFLALGIFVSFIQAFVFSLLSTIYVSLALPHDDHH